MQVETQVISEPEPQAVIAEYSKDELKTIVNFVKQMTILYMLNDTDWTDECAIIIRRWLTSSDNYLLTCFYDGDVLKASLNIPEVPVYDFMYFLREPNAKFTVDSFHDEVTFGRIHEDVEGTLLMLLERLHAPIILASSLWSPNTKSYLSGSFQSFLANVTRLHYMMSGIAVFYVPHQVVLIDEATVLANSAMMKQIEVIAAHWVSIFRTSLCDKRKISPYNSTNLCEEYEFWLYRCEMLRHPQIYNC